jgi:hypothetical protein
MGAAGTDLLLSPAAKRLIPFDHECKNVERLNFWDAVKQAEANTTAGRQPVMIAHRNGSPIYATVRFDYLIQLLQKSTVRFDEDSCPEGQVMGRRGCRELGQYDG